MDWLFVGLTTLVLGLSGNSDTAEPYYPPPQVAYPEIQAPQPLSIDYPQYQPMPQYQAPPVYSVTPPPYMTRVNPYSRNDGTSVQGYYRTPRDGYQNNNFSNYRY